MKLMKKIILTTTLFLETNITESKKMKREELFNFFLRGISTSLDEVVCFSDRIFKELHTLQNNNFNYFSAPILEVFGLHLFV